jgi:hypothetical protein
MDQLQEGMFRQPVVIRPLQPVTRPLPVVRRRQSPVPTLKTIEISLLCSKTNNNRKKQ